MNYFLSMLFFLLFSTLASAQNKKSFRLSINKKVSFYDKHVIQNINKELSRFERTIYDTAFVYIDDRHGTLIDSYIAIKNKKRIRIFYLLFGTTKDKYYVAELNSSKIGLGHICDIYQLVSEANFSKKDSLISIPDDYRCNLYFGMGKNNKEFRTWGSNFGKDTSNLMSFISGVNGYTVNSDSYELSYYFAAEDFAQHSKLPAIVKNYRLVKYFARKN